MLDETPTVTEQPCPTCDGTGYNPAARLLFRLWYRHLHADAPGLLTAFSFPTALREFAATILASRRAWSEQLDQADVDALVENDRLWDFTRRPHTPDEERLWAAHGWYWSPGPQRYRPTAAEVNAACRAYPIHDGINAYLCVRARLARWDMGDTCPRCRGTAVIPVEPAP